MSIKNRLPQLISVSIGFLIGAIGVHWLQEQQDRRLLEEAETRDGVPADHLSRKE